MPTVSDQSEKDCLKYCRHSIWKGIYILIENMPIGSNRGLWVQTDTHRFKSRVIGSTQKINSTWYSTIPKKIEIC